MNTYTALALATLIALVIGAGIIVLGLSLEENKPNRISLIDYLELALSPLPILAFMGVLTCLS